MNDLLSLNPVHSDRDIPRLRKLYDECETHYRGLKALGVYENTYSSVVVPAIMQKMPENFRLNITRGEEFLKSSMEEMLKAFIKELELREDHFYVVNKLNLETDKRKETIVGGAELQISCLPKSTIGTVPSVWANTHMRTVKG